MEEDGSPFKGHVVGLRVGGYSTIFCSIHVVFEDEVGALKRK